MCLTYDMSDWRGLSAAVDDFLRAEEGRGGSQLYWKSATAVGEPSSAVKRDVSSL